MTEMHNHHVPQSWQKTTMVNICSAPHQQVLCASDARSVTLLMTVSSENIFGSLSGSVTKIFLSTTTVIQRRGRGYRITEAPLPAHSATTVSWGEAGVCARACRPNGKQSERRARPRTTAQATSRGDFYPLHPFRPHHGRPSGCGGRGGRTRLRQAGRAEAEERTRSEEPQVHRALL